jgi:uncharacterized protein (TIGR03546 family)
MAIALGFCYGTALGLTPRATPQWVVLFLAVFLLRVNLITTFLAFSFTFFLFDWVAPLFHAIGLWVLADLSVLRPVFTTLYHSPLFPYLQFNNSVVFGSFLSLLLLLPAVYGSTMYGQRVFRPRLKEILLKNYFWRMLNTQHFERRAK